MWNLNSSGLTAAKSARLGAGAWGVQLGAHVLDLFTGVNLCRQIANPDGTVAKTVWLYFSLQLLSSAKITTKEFMGILKYS